MNPPSPSGKTCRVVGLPAPFSELDYEQAGSEIDAALAGLAGAVAVYRTGGVSAPGISDLDRVVVLEHPVSVGRAWAQLSPRAREIAMHSPFAVDAQTFRRQRWFSSLEPLECVWGEELQAEAVPGGSYLPTLHATEGLILALLKMAKQLATRRIKARSSLCILHSLRHSLRLAELDRGAAPRLWRCMEETGALRDSWFGLPAHEREDRLRRLVAASPAAISEALGALPARPASGSLRGGRGFETVTLAPGPTLRAVAETRRVGAKDRLLALSRRGGELYWRAAPRRIFVPAPAIGWLERPRGGDEAGLRERRDRIVSEYAGFIRAAGPDASSIGFALSFA